MNYRKKAHIKIKPYRPVSLRSFTVPRKRRGKHRSFAGRYRKPNHWHQHDELTFSKVLIRDVELMWLEVYAEFATISLEFVNNHANMPDFISGRWDGRAYFVRFPKDKLNDAIMFRITWWNSVA